MDTLNLTHLIAAVVFIGSRVSGLMVFCPFLSSDAIPSPLKAALTILITSLLYPLHGSPQLPVQSWQWLSISLSELVIGLLLGLSANLLMEAPLLAGQILGVQMGYSLASLFDPQTQADTPVLGELHRLAALLIFLQLDVHHWIIRALARSFAYLPAGDGPLRITAGTALLQSVGGIFLTGVQIAAPALAATLMADVMLGFLGKASPQLPVLFIGMSIKNLLGLAVLVGVVAYWPRIFSEHFAVSVSFAERLLHLVH